MEKVSSKSQKRKYVVTEEEISRSKKKVSNDSETIGTKKLKDIDAVNAVDSLAIEKVKVMSDCLQSITSWSHEKLEIITKDSAPVEGIEEILQDSAAVEDANSLSSEHLKLIITCSSNVLDILQDTKALTTITSWSHEKLEIVRDREILDSDTFEGIDALCEEKLRIICKINSNGFLMDIFRNPTTAERVNFLSSRKLEEIIKIDSFYVKKIMEDPATVEVIDSLNIEKLKVMLNIIPACDLMHALKDAPTMKEILDIDIERNFKFALLIAYFKNSILDRELDFFFDSEAIYKEVIRFISFFDFSANEIVLQEVKGATYSVFHDDDPTKLLKLSLLQFLKELSKALQDL